MSKSPLRLGLAGLGTVGASVFTRLCATDTGMTTRAGRPLQIVAVSARGQGKDRGLDLSKVRFETNPVDLAMAADVDVVIELMGGAEGAAFDLCKAALNAGKPVITANKALLAAHGVELARLAEEKGVALKYEAAVAGGIPIIKAVAESLAGNVITGVQGILNGTCNYILTRMGAEKLPFDVVLADAQRLGYAEADPATDVDGFDTAHKLALLASLAFGMPPDLGKVSVEGIRSITPLDLSFAAELGYKIKLLGSASVVGGGNAARLSCRVAPTLVPLSSPLANVDGVLNAVLVQGDAVGAATFIGRGAGGDPTASAVIGDIVDVARGLATLPFGVPVGQLRPLDLVAAEEALCPWYIRLHVTDQPGVVADISAILRDEAISIESLLQHGRSKTDSVPVILTTHGVSEAALLRAMAKIAKLKAVWQEPFCLRIAEQGH